METITVAEARQRDEREPYREYEIRIATTMNNGTPVWALEHPTLEHDTIYDDVEPAARRLNSLRRANPGEQYDLRRLPMGLLVDQQRVVIPVF